MKLQITLDTVCTQDGISLVRDVAESVDIIEVGNPLLLDEGVSSVEQVRDAFSSVEVMADTKIWHNGARIAQSAFSHGASMVTVLAGVSDEEVEAVVEVASSWGGQVVADLSGASGVIQRAAELEELGVSYMMIPSGLRVYEHELMDQDVFHRNTRAIGGMPLALVRNVNRALHGHAQVAVVDNITLDNLDAVVATHPGILLVGRAILAADDPAAAAAEFKRRMNAAV